MDVRVRGNAHQLLEKYKTLARDAAQQGDRVTAEYYLQYADHYYRVLNDGRPRHEEQRGRQRDYQDDDGMAEEGVEGFRTDTVTMTREQPRMPVDAPLSDNAASDEPAASSDGEVEAEGAADAGDDGGARRRGRGRGRGRPRRDAEGEGAPDLVTADV